MSAKKKVKKVTKRKVPKKKPLKKDIHPSDLSDLFADVPEAERANYMNPKKDTMMSVEKHNIIVSNLYDELRRKDKQIKELEEKNRILFMTSLKTAKKNAEASERMKNVVNDDDEEDFALK